MGTRAERASALRQSLWGRRLHSPPAPAPQAQLAHLECCGFIWSTYSDRRSGNSTTTRMDCFFGLQGRLPETDLRRELENSGAP